MKRGFLLDMDGVIYRGPHAIPGAQQFIETLTERQIPFLFLTNNSRSTERDLVARLKTVGIKTTEQHIFTSATATARFLASQKPGGTAYVLGEGGLILSLHAHGYTIVDSKPDYVVVGEGRSLTVEMVEKAINFVIGGSKLIATNLDPSPKAKEFSKPGTGAIVAMLEEATGKKAFSVGKPSPIMMRAARKALGLQTAETIMIGDTLETDVLGGVNMGYTTILVLSGITNREHLNTCPFQPDLVYESIADLPLDEVLNETGNFSSPDTKVRRQRESAEKV